MNNQFETKIIGSVTAKRSGIGVEALVKEDDNVRVNQSNGSVYIDIGFDVKMRLSAAKAAELKAAL